MRAVVQRVHSARVTVNARETGRIGRGLLVFVGVGHEDGPADIEYIAGKIGQLRIFEDNVGKMNRSVIDVGGEVLLVSQFTLYGDCRRGRRPSFDGAAPPGLACSAYAALIEALRAGGLKVQTGEFQAMMCVELVNEGPVTLLLDSGRAF
jgi:D-tyrosyl-tRNA(Tyr) deacylase